MPTKQNHNLSHSATVHPEPPNHTHAPSSTSLEQLPFFELGLIPEICERVAKIGYTIPTPIQREAIPLILEGHDAIGIAQTGTGKTAAFMLPLIDSLLCSPKAKNKQQPRVLVLAPTRELATQNFEATVSFAQGTKLRAVVVFGGVGQRPQEREIEKGCDILIATPGR
ncbi:MAG: DEAD/DEAH box helicase, partial [Candidatus Kapaibacterium sp.]